MLPMFCSWLDDPLPDDIDELLPSEAQDWFDEHERFCKVSSLTLDLIEAAIELAQWRLKDPMSRYRYLVYLHSEVTKVTTDKDLTIQQLMELGLIKAIAGVPAEAAAVRGRDERS